METMFDDSFCLKIVLFVKLFFNEDRTVGAFYAKSKVFCDCLSVFISFLGMISRAHAEELLEEKEVRFDAYALHFYTP